MSGKRRRKLKSRRATLEVKNDNLELQSWSDLPAELLELILSRLNLVDNVYASAVCKRWCSVAAAVRIANQSPWLMYFPKVGNRHDFYDPVQRKIHSLELPRLSGSRVCYARDGWLLLYRLEGHCVFFFNPFSQETIKLPKFELFHERVAFSCTPTSSECVVFSVKYVSHEVVAISTCHPGAREWTTVSYQNRSTFYSSIWNQILFCNGFFYCLSITGWIGVFDPYKSIWKILSVPPPKRPVSFFEKKFWKGKFMTEHEGVIIVIYTCYDENPIVFMLDDTLMRWEEMSTLNGLTLFTSFLSSCSRTDIAGIMRNNVYFSKFRLHGRRCLSFSLDDHRYYPCKQWHGPDDWKDQDPFESIWIEPPKDFSGFL